MEIQNTNVVDILDVGSGKDLIIPTKIHVISTLDKAYVKRCGENSVYRFPFGKENSSSLWLLVKYDTDEEEYITALFPAKTTKVVFD